MEITPQDLGEKWRKDLLKRRAIRRIQRSLRTAPGSDSEFGMHARRKRTHRLARAWVKSARLPKSDAEAVGSEVSPETVGLSLQSLFRQGLGGGAFIFLAIFGWFAFIQASNTHSASQDSEWMLVGAFGLPVAWLMFYTVIRAFVSPRLAVRGINTDAVTAAEIEAFLPTARGELDRAYLNTVLETLRQPLPATAGQDIRTALRAVGDTISVLPGSLLEQGADDPVVLRLAALEKRQRADAETDSVSQTSLRRQADADERQAQILEHSNTAAKRARARHDETVGQINTLRSVLTVYASPENAAHLEQGSVLQDAVRRVAGEAVAASAAKRELEEGEIIALYGSPLPEPQIQTVGRQSSGKNPQPSGKWWQGTSGNG
ncbi:MAG: hypothetical protein H8F28_18760 [Fibrella sp.]|nr:hypothetical protein [Armatimonadota bacterium]